MLEDLILKAKNHIDLINTDNPVQTCIEKYEYEGMPFEAHFLPYGVGLLYTPKIWETERVSPEVEKHIIVNSKGELKSVKVRFDLCQIKDGVFAIHKEVKVNARSVARDVGWEGHSYAGGPYVREYEHIPEKTKLVYEIIHPFEPRLYKFLKTATKYHKDYVNFMRNE